MEHRYFYEDSVYRVGPGGVWFGLVLDNCENSESSDGEGDALQKGELRVLWHPSGREQVLSDAKVGLADRALMPGDVVRRMIKGKDTQRGYCRDILVTGAVQVVGTNLVLPVVPSERLQPLDEYTSDLAVCLDSWVGISKIVHSKLRLISSDGSKFEFPDVNLCMLEDYHQRKRRGNRSSGCEHHAANEYYPGQTVIGPLLALDHAMWLNMTREMETLKKHKMREQKFTVESVVTESIGVHWQCRALGEQSDGGPPQQPRFLVEGDDLRRLKLLNLFEPCTLQVGAKNFLTLTPEDTFCTKTQWKKTQNKIYRTLRKQTRSVKTSKSKESLVKEGKDPNTASSTQDVSNVHPFKMPTKSKRRLSSFSRDGRYFYYHNVQSQLARENQNNSNNTKEISNDTSSKEDQKMDVDIVIMDDDKNANVEKDTEKNVVNVKPDEASHLDIPDVSCNGRSASDRSCSPEIEGLERRKKLRKSRISSGNNSRSASPAVQNGEFKPDARMEVNDSDSWGNTTSDEGTDTDSCATWSSQCSSSTNNSSGRGKKSPHLATKFFKGKRLKKTARRNSTTLQPKPGDRVVVETLCTKSKANVVWQDGTIEYGIPSTELYPIHHLDGQECFPGDFVISGVTGDSAPSLRDYGVVQKVDHHGRTAVVKWFRTYTSSQEPIPQLISESEVSVYDLKDHPDFQYRPGTVVIRVANFTGAEASCTAGQVMDNYPTGRVHVWWVDGHTSMCWPQDLYKVGEYDSDEGDIWADEGSGSEDSWETQSSAGNSSPGSHKEVKDGDKENEHEGLTLPIIDDAAVKAVFNSISGELPKVPRGLEPRAAAHIEKGLNGMARLEEILSQNPSLQSHEIMRKLLALYKDCRFLDRLMGTSFFHEDHFQGLLERVRERGNRESNSTSAGIRRVQKQVMRLFSKDDPNISSHSVEDKNSKANLASVVQAVDNPPTDKKGLMNIPLVPQLEINSSKPDENVSKSNSTVDTKPNETSLGDNSGHSNFNESLFDNCHMSSKNTSLRNTLSPLNTANKCGNLSPMSDGSLSKYATPSGSMNDIVNQADKSPNHSLDKNKYEDSGIDSQSFSISHSVNTATASSALDLSNTGINAALHENNASEVSKLDVASGSSTSQLSNQNVCQKLCALIFKQLLMACTEINRRRDSLLVAFLNRLMNENVTTGAPLPYRFSVQFGNVVVTMDDEDNKTEEAKVNADENVEQKVAETIEPIVAPQEEKSEEPVINSCTGVELGEGFLMNEAVPSTHRFRLSILQPSEPRSFHQAIKREIKLMKSDLPAGVWVRGYEDRMDLLSIMIAGPAKTPYEDGLFLFDVQLGGEYPRAPPLCHYISYCSDRLNPNLYEDGKVCVSLLGTWSGRGVEVWGRDSSLLQVIVSIQGLILCAEPYFNEAGFDKQKGSQQGNENSRMYNEMVLLKLVQSLTKMILHPPEIFKSEILAHQSRHASVLFDRLTHWMRLSEQHNSQFPETPLSPNKVFDTAPILDLQRPEFPLIPASRGFCLSLHSSLEAYCNALTKVGISFEKKL